MGLLLITTLEATEPTCEVAKYAGHARQYRMACMAIGVSIRSREQ
jgi:hypothetical protein